MSARPVRRRQLTFVASKIRQLRKERSLTQSELARRIGIQQSDLCRMETGEYKVSLDTLFRILGVFGMDVAEFFREDLAPRSPHELDQEVLRLFHQLDETGRQDVLDYLRFKTRRHLEFRAESW